MSVRQMSSVWLLDLEPPQQSVLLALADHADDDGYCYPSIERIAWKTNYSESQVRRILVALRTARLLDRVQDLPIGRGHFAGFKLFLENGIKKPKFVPRKGRKMEPFPKNKGAQNHEIPRAPMRDDLRTGADPSITNHQGTISETRSSDARHAPLKLFVEFEYKRITSETLPTDASSWVKFAAMLKAYKEPSYPTEYFQASWTAFLTDTNSFHRTQANPLRYWASRPHAFSANIQRNSNSNGKRHGATSEDIDAATQRIVNRIMDEDLPGDDTHAGD